MAKFPVGARVKAVKTWYGYSNLQGELATITKSEFVMQGDDFVEVEWDNKNISSGPGNLCYAYRFEVIGANTAIETGAGTGGSNCPRCNNALGVKKTIDPFSGKEYTIDKCEKCGWC